MLDFTKKKNTIFSHKQWSAKLVNTLGNLSFPIWYSEGNCNVKFHSFLNNKQGVVNSRNVCLAYKDGRETEIKLVHICPSHTCTEYQGSMHVLHI